ncbi:hypothetical protein [Cryomorpha ignava]|uniref:hypothetical protein n=1 Tax=Cryomorpha ignava TaxID=101383 RepID=UPI0019548D65|nr:hypothetical protein [Cryomorpha ignava]
MKLTELRQRPDLKANDKLESAYIQFGKLISELNAKEIPNEVALAINKEIEDLNTTTDSGKDLRNHIRQNQTRIIKLLEKEVKLVTRNHHRNTWLAIGMAAFGIPLGVAFGASLGNMAFIGIGLPIGLAIGVAVGTKLDNKAAEEGRQLDLELKY